MKRSSINAIDYKGEEGKITKKDLMNIYRELRTSFFDQYKSSIPENVRLSILHQVGHAVIAFSDGCPLVIVGEGPLAEIDISNDVEPGTRSVRFLHHPMECAGLTIRKRDKFQMAWNQTDIILAGPAIELMVAGYCSEEGAKDIAMAQNIMRDNGLRYDAKEIRSRIFHVNVTLKVWWFKIASVCLDLAEEYVESPVNFKAYIPGLLSEEDLEIERWLKKEKNKCSWPSWIKLLAA